MYYFQENYNLVCLNKLYGSCIVEHIYKFFIVYQIQTYYNLLYSTMFRNYFI